MSAPPVRRGNVESIHPFRCVLGRILLIEVLPVLIEVLPVDTVRIALHRDRPFFQMGSSQ